MIGKVMRYEASKRDAPVDPMCVELEEEALQLGFSFKINKHGIRCAVFTPAGELAEPPSRELLADVAQARTATANYSALSADAHSELQVVLRDFLLDYAVPTRARALDTARGLAALAVSCDVIAHACEVLLADAGLQTSSVDSAIQKVRQAVVQELEVPLTA